MEAFNSIRKHAREKRDKLIAQARTEYAATLVRIAELEQDLTGSNPPGKRTMSSCIHSALPTDRPFTTVDILTALEAMDPGRVWRKHTIDSYISRLRERRIVRRLRKSRGTEPALYARAGVQVDAQPFGDKTLAQVVGEVLGAKSLTQTELVMAMIDAGYQSTMTPQALRNAVGVVLREGPFKRREGKWRRYESG